VKIWDAPTGKQLLKIEEAHRGYVGRLVFSPDGQRLASAGTDYMIKIWDVRTVGRSRPSRGTNALPSG